MTVVTPMTDMCGLSPQPYVEELSRVMGHANRVEPFRSYCTGFLLPGKRKSVEPMAARLRQDRTSAEGQLGSLSGIHGFWPFRKS